MTTAAYPQLFTLVALYKKVLPIWTFPFIPLGIAAIFQSFAWMSGPIFLANMTLLPRMFVLWILALFEYMWMSPAMNAGVEVLGMQEPLLVVVYQVMTLVVFMMIDIFIFQKDFKIKYVISFLFLSIAVYIAYMW